MELSDHLRVEGRASASEALMKHCLDVIGWLTKKFWLLLATASSPDKVIFTQIEDHPPGYPRFASLIGAHSAFSLSRRFTVARMRLLLHKQDRVSILEQRLRELDQNEDRPLFLGSVRRDRNPERETVLRELDHALADYDALVERNGKILRLPSVTKRNRASLINWVEGTGSICRQEASFLYQHDLCASVGSNDVGLTAVETFVERVLVPLCRYIRKPGLTSLSRDEDVYIFRQSAVTTVAQLLMTWLLIALLIIPIITIQAIDGIALQVLSLMLASGVFVFVLSSLVRARMAELFVAGATYAALLVVFFSSSRKNGS